MNEIISVVIPVYNVEKYITECLDSVVSQTYRNLQIILVDDGSTDNSGKICDDYASKDERVKVIHQQNHGAGAAKNAGLDLVKGEYFSIIDSDDFIDKNMYESMLKYLKNGKAEVVQCRFRNYFVNGATEPFFANYFKEQSKITSEQYLIEMLSDWKLAIFWNKLFKTSLLQGTRFPVGRKIDDEFFTYKLISRAHYIMNVDEAFYNYRIRKSSVMKSNNDESLMSDRIDCFTERYNYICKKFPNLVNQYYRHLSDLLLFYQKQAVSENLKNKISELIVKYPYKKPPVYKRIIHKLTREQKVSDISIDDYKEYLLFE